MMSEDDRKSLWMLGIVFGLIIVGFAVTLIGAWTYDFL